MAPIAAVAPASSQSATPSNTDSLLNRGKNLRRASTLYRPRHQQQLPTPRHGEEGSLQAHRPRDRQSYQIAPRQQTLYLPDSQRPSSSRSHMRGWDQQEARSRSPSCSKKLPLSDSSSQQTQAESFSSSLPPSSASMTSEEFEALPPVLLMLLSSGGKQLGTCERWLVCFSLPSSSWLASPCIPHRHVLAYKYVMTRDTCVGERQGSLACVAGESTNERRNKGNNQQRSDQQGQRRHVHSEHPADWTTSVL